MSTKNKSTQTETTDENKKGVISVFTQRTATSEISQGQSVQSSISPERVSISHDKIRNRHDTCLSYCANVPQSNLHTGSYNSDIPIYYKSKYGIPSSQIQQIPRIFNPFEGNYLRPVSESVIRAGNQVIHRGIKFSGKSSENGPEFLRLLADIIIQYGIQENEVLNFIPFTLEKLALDWYRIEVRNFRNYKDFYDSFEMRFVPPDYQDRLSEDINSRRQGPTETLLEYLTEMQILFSYLDNPPLIEQQINLICRNSHPRYILFINAGKIQNYHDFVEEAHIIETKMRLALRYKPPPPPEESYFPELAYHGKGDVHSSDNDIHNVMGYFDSLTVDSSESELENTSEVNIVSSVKKADKKASVRTRGVCFNCGQFGHIARECRGYKRK